MDPEIQMLILLISYEFMRMIRVAILVYQKVKEILILWYTKFQFQSMSTSKTKQVVYNRVAVSRTKNNMSEAIREARSIAENYLGE